MGAKERRRAARNGGACGGPASAHPPGEPRTAALPRLCLWAAPHLLRRQYAADALRQLLVVIVRGAGHEVKAAQGRPAGMVKRPAGTAGPCMRMPAAQALPKRATRGMRGCGPSLDAAGRLPSQRQRFASLSCTGASTERSPRPHLAHRGHDVVCLQRQVLQACALVLLQERLDLALAVERRQGKWPR